MTQTTRRVAMLGAAAALGVGGWRFFTRPRALTPEQLQARHATPLPRPESAMRVYHLGHSLVGRDMPAFLAQIAEHAGLGGHGYNSQLGWGTSLRAHWEASQPITGFDDMNHPPAWRDPFEALDSGSYDSLILTEMVELRDAIRWHDSGRYLARWAARARRGRSDIRLYLFESWHGLDVEDGWLQRLDRDPPKLWEGTLLAQAMAQPDTGAIHIIPTGRVMAALVRAVEGQGGLPGMTDRSDLFLRDADGALDPIHVGDLGNYLNALVHFSVLYHRPAPLPPQSLLRADGSDATLPPDALDALMRDICWRVVTRLPATGLPMEGTSP
ncbi:MAG: hypothetical protein JJT99_04395 [Rhodobacteraceae bacterium]|nr:hypothetical protein [Paracoccaceae bacterium]